MPFSASTCLTDLGTVVLGGTFNIYSNVDNYTSPFQTNVTYSQLFGPLCPYVMGNVPNGTNTIRIIDTLSKCCATLELLSNDLCTTCELSFDSYQTSNIGIIVAGELTGSCENDITDYRIFWYGPNSSTNLAFTSGYGSSFVPYNLTHPLVGITSPMVEAGTYIPVIDKVKLNGLNYSQTGGTGYIQAELECFNATTVNVQPFTCDNGTQTSGNYTHRVNFSSAAAGTIPLTLQSTFDLDLTTNYFAWKFQGQKVPDSLKITFYGSAYSNPIILEYWVIGADNTNNVSLTTLPKLAKTTDTSFVSKVTSLTQLSRNVGDYLILEVIPNPNNTQTNWDFYFTCLDTFDCSLGCVDSYLNTPYKIKTTSITNVPVGNCGIRRIGYDLSGCTQNQINSLDISKYMAVTFYNIQTAFSNMSTDNTTSLLNTIADYYTGKTQCSAGYGSGSDPVCYSPANSNIIKFEKTISGGIGEINMVFSNLNDLIVYKSSYDTLKSTSGWVNDPTNINYYKAARLAVPNTTGNEICGDDTSPIYNLIHFSSVMTTGGTAPNYTLTMPMPTITNQLPSFSNCEVDCQSSIIQWVNGVNNVSTGTANNTNGYRITNTGSRYTDPFSFYSYFGQVVSSTQYSGYSQGVFIVNNSLNSTVPFSGSSSPYVQIPSLSAQTCNFSSIGETFYPNLENQSQYIFVYDNVLVITNPPNLTSFQIKSNIIVNGARTTTNYPVTAVTVVNGVVTTFNPGYAF
jgi:hypothetical protein